MSYILDALKRADAERERGHVPGLRTQPMTAGSLVNAGSAARRWLIWLGAALIGLALLAAASVWWRADSGDAATESAPAGPSAAIPEPAATNASNPASDTPSEPAPAAVLQAPTLPILTPEPPRLKSPRPAVATSGPSSSAKVASEASAEAASPGSTAPPATTTVATPSPSSIRSFGDLSPEERARLPAINVSGSTYSKNPALRMLIVNGKVSLEGEEVAPGLKLETIEPRTAVLNHQGLRYRIGY